jgi:hypothetical protein
MQSNEPAKPIAALVRLGEVFLAFSRNPYVKDPIVGRTVSGIDVRLIPRLAVPHLQLFIGVLEEHGRGTVKADSKLAQLLGGGCVLTTTRRW